MKASIKFHLCLNVILHTFVLSNISPDDIDENSLSVANLMKIPNSLVCIINSCCFLSLPSKGTLPHYGEKSYSTE